MDLRDRLIDFFTPEAGQRRTQALYGLLGDVGEAVSPMLSPRGRQQAQGIVNLIDMFNPVSSMSRAGSEFQQGNYGSSAVEVAGFAIPAGILAKYGTKTAVDAARNLSEMLAVSGGNIRDLSESAFEAAIQRMNQPGEMPTVGSNFGNIGHNQGPSLQPDEIIPPARPKYIREYSASLDAATKLPQERGTFEQMRKMMLDRGAKEDELIWSGFDREFRDQGKVTKEGIIDYLSENAGENMLERYYNQVEGIIDEDAFKSSDELVERFVQDNLDDETNYYLNERRQEDLEYNRDMYDLFKPDEITGDNANYLMQAYQNGEIDFNPNKIPEDKYVYFDKGNFMKDDDIRLLNEDEALDMIYDEDTAREMAADDLMQYASDLDVVELRERLGLGDTADVGESGVEFAEYFTPGSKNYTENRYAYEAPLSNIRSSQMDFTEAHHDEPNIMVHTRTGEFPLATGGGNVHHVGEIQSDWAQQLRRQQERSAQYGKAYDARTFDEIADYTKGENSSRIVYGIQNEAVKIYKSMIADDPDLKAKVNNYSASPMGRFSPLNDPERNINDPSFDAGNLLARMQLREQAFNNTRDPSNAEILDYFMSSGANEPFAKSFREQNQELYAKHKGIVDKAREINKKDAKEGGPLIESTNKWVDFALRRELVDAVATGNEYMTISNPDMVRDMTMGQVHGQSEFYGKIVPQRLKKLLRTFDKKANLEEIEIQTGNGVKKVLGVRLTDDLVRKIADKSMPIFSVPVGAGLLGAMNREEQKRENPSGLLGVY